MPDPSCSTGILNGNVCCLASCGQCGGDGCSGLPGGSANCCVGPIRDAAASCTGARPPSVLSDPDCATGIRSGNTCCDKACGRCGGSACSSLPGGSDACCGGTISGSGRSCETNMPPCIIE